MLVPRQAGWGGELPDSGCTIGDEKQRPVPRLSYHASGTPPPTSQMFEPRTNRRAVYFHFDYDLTIASLFGHVLRESIQEFFVVFVVAFFNI